MMQEPGMTAEQAGSSESPPPTSRYDEVTEGSGYAPLVALFAIALIVGGLFMFVPAEEKIVAPAKIISEQRLGWTGQTVKLTFDSTNSRARETALGKWQADHPGELLDKCREMTSFLQCDIVIEIPK